VGYYYPQVQLWRSGRPFSAIIAPVLWSRTGSWFYQFALFAAFATPDPCKKVEVKSFPYSLPSIGLGANPGVQAVSPQVTKPSTWQ